MGQTSCKQGCVGECAFINSGKNISVPQENKQLSVTAILDNSVYIKGPCREQSVLPSVLPALISHVLFNPSHSVAEMYRHVESRNQMEETAVCFAIEFSENAERVPGN